MPSNVLNIEDYRKRRQESTKEYLEKAYLFVATHITVHQEVVDRGQLIIEILDELLCKPHVLTEERKALIESKLYEIFGDSLSRWSK